MPATICQDRLMSARSSFRVACAAFTFTVTASIAPTVLLAQAPVNPALQPNGPVIQSTGQSYKVENPTFDVPKGHVFKALFVINAGGGDSIKVNEQLTTVARFYNVHVRHGYDEKNVKAAAIFHGQGWPALLTDSAFAARFGGKPNPSRKLVEELLQHGAQLVLCGQTAGGRGIRRDELIPGVKVAISAMTAMNVLQSQGYLYNPW
jgi:intracellular sulfur oxidation DsrE/DsrF family protein